MTMIYEHRTYRLKNGSAGEYLQLVGGEGIAIQRRHLGQLVGYFTTEIGPLNEITHIWAYADLADRDRRRAALLTDPEWLAFLPKIQVLIEEGTNKILKPAPFSPLA
nr:NIPSNAP family protein [uncultured Dongia sp.]